MSGVGDSGEGSTSAVDSVHLEEAADTLLLALDRVEHRGALGELAGVDARERERADERVVHHLRARRESMRVRTVESSRMLRWRGCWVAETPPERATPSILQRPPQQPR
eukprot:3430978-Rhodomonas_salina.4